MQNNIPTLYFLRSSEQYVIKQLLPISIDPSQDIEFYGLTTKDLGLYTLINNSIVGAVWVRKKDFNEHPILNIAVKKEFQNEGIARLMMKQVLDEASSIFETLEVLDSDEKNISDFLSKFDFIKEKKSMIIKLTKSEKKDLYDDYSLCKWMEP